MTAPATRPAPTPLPTGPGLRLRITELARPCPDVAVLVLAHAGVAPLPAWSPGAHVDLHLPGGAIRPYSLCGDPADRHTWRVAVLREPEGRGGSRTVHEELRPGDVLSATGPRNRFPLVDAPEYRFVAGGIGITPILPMIHAVAGSGARWSLLYGGRTRSGMTFLPELERYGDRVLIRPQDEYGHLDLRTFLAAPPPGTAVYCCGPGPLLDAAEHHCTALPPGTLHTERFTPTTPPAPEGDTAFEVELRRTARTVTVEPDVSILEALEDAGIDVPNSCREGICGTCETTVLAGRPDHRDELLSPAERSSGATMMICVGRSLDDRLVLDL